MDHDDTTQNVYEKVDVLLDAGRVDDAIALAKLEISRSPDNTDLYMMLAGIYYDLDRYGDAREYAEAATQLDPSVDVANRQLAWIELKQNHFAAAYQHAKRALELNPDSIDNINITAWCAHYNNKNKLAIDLVEHGLELEPENVQLHVLDGIIAFKQKKYDKFDQAFQAALALEMEDSWIYQQYAEHLMEIERFYEAGEYYACAVKFEPDNEELKQRLHKSVQFLLTSSLLPEQKVLDKLHPNVQEIYLQQHAKAGKLDHLPKWVRTSMIIIMLIVIWSVAPLIEYIRKGVIGDWVEDWLYLGAGAILFVLIAPAIDEFLIKRKSKSRFKY